VGHILVLDIGTSSVKAVLFDARGGILAEAETSYQTTAYPDGRQEQDPSDWIAATRTAVRRLAPDPTAIKLMVLSGTMQSVIPVDEEGNAIRPAILYSDGRATAELAELSPQFCPQTETLGNCPNEFMAAFKIAWLRRHEPEAFARTATFHSGSKDFVLQWLTGERVTDPTAASTVGLMDLQRRTWIQSLTHAIGVEHDRLPNILPGNQVVGELLGSAATALGLLEGTPVMNGSGDAGASTLGAGIDGEGGTYVYVGTTAWAAQVHSQADNTSADRQSVYSLAHPSDPLQTIRIGAMLSGGDSAAWLAEALARPLEELDRLVGSEAFRPTGAMFLPYLKGERCPFLDSGVRAGFVQLTRTDGAAELHRAVIEGIALAIRTNVDALGPVQSDVLLLGGGALSAHLPQILADCLEHPVLVAQSPSSVTALGCFRLGARTLGWADARPVVAERIMPGQGSAGRVSARLGMFRQTTELLRQLSRSA